MFKRGWLAIFTFAGFILTAPAHGKLINKDLAETSVSQNGQLKSEADIPSTVLIGIRNDIQRIALALEATNQRQASQQERNYSAHYLQSQENMAMWAGRMFWVALGEMLITSFGVFLVWRTLKATWAAKNEAKRAADAAEKALAASDRPHMILAELVLSAIEDGPEETKNGIKAAFQYQNHGEDLAFLKTYGFLYIVQPSGIPLPADIGIKVNHIHWPLVPKEGWGTKINSAGVAINLTESLRSGINDGTQILYILSSLTYKDASGTLHETECVHYFRGGDRKVVPLDDERHWKYT